MPLPSEMPVFQAVLGAEWDRLGAVVRRHYVLRPFSRDTISVTGAMEEVRHGRVARLILPLARVFGALVPYTGRDVPITVHYEARPDSAEIHWNRVFRFPGRPPFPFRSHMEPVGPGRVIEFVRFGVGIRLRVTAEDGALVFRDEGYVWRILGRDIPIPGAFLLGHTYVEERPLDAESFSMRMSLHHPLFGEVFGYSGRFRL